MKAIGLGRWLLLGGICYVLFAVAQLPAGVAIRWLAPEGTTFSGVSGSAWNGNAATVLSNGLTLSDVRWSLKPWKLLLLSAGAEINAKVPGGAVRTDLSASLLGNKGSAKNLRGVLKLEDLSPLLRLPVQVGGNAGLRFDEVRWSNGAMTSATGEIQLADVREMATDTALGNFSVTFSPTEDGSTRGVFTDTEAVFGLDGAVVLNPDRSYAVEAQIEPTNTTPQSVTTAIGMLGASRDEGGAYTLKSQGSY